MNRSISVSSMAILFGFAAGSAQACQHVFWNGQDMGCIDQYRMVLGSGSYTLFANKVGLDALAPLAQAAGEGPSLSLKQVDGKFDVTVTYLDKGKAEEFSKRLNPQSPSALMPK